MAIRIAYRVGRRALGPVHCRNKRGILNQSANTGAQSMTAPKAIEIAANFISVASNSRAAVLEHCLRRSQRRRRRLTVTMSPSILSDMVNYQERLDRTFAALVDPTRRAILARLERKDGASVSELAEPFAIKLPAVMKHLDVLDHAGLITRVKSGRTVTVKLRPQPMREAMEWLSRYERFWSARLDKLAAYAEEKEAEARRKER